MNERVLLFKVISYACVDGRGRDVTGCGMRFGVGWRMSGYLVLICW